MSAGRGRWARWLVWCAVLAAIAAMAARADAHALLSTSDPPSGATLSHSPAQVVVTFTEQPDAGLSQIRVLDTAGQTRAGGRPETVPGKANTLRIPVPDLPNGVYTVTWRTLSKADGHLAAGSYSFGVGVSPAGAVAPRSAIVRSPRPGRVAVTSRWVYFAGLVGLLGLTFAELFILPAGVARRRIGGGLILCWVLAAAGVAGITQSQRLDAHVAIGHLWGSSLGHSLRVRGLPVLGGGAALLVALGVRDRARQVGVALLATATLTAMLAEVTAGHAAATSRWEWYRVGTQWLHFAAVGVWVGGLAALLACLSAVPPDLRRSTVRRFSRAAAVALLVVALTGTLRAVDEIATWHELFSTGFGQLVIIKVVLLSVLVLLGAANRYRSVPAVDRSERGLRSIGTAELSVMALVLAVTAVLVNLAPARSATLLSAVVLRPIVVDAHDFATTVRLHLTITPGAAAFNQFRLLVTDYDTGRAVTADQVALRFHYPNRADVGDSTLVLVRVADGSYTAPGANLSLEGRWDVTVLVQRAGQSVEVPIEVVPQFPRQPTDVQRSPGLPTFYNVHVTGQRQLQVYLDPGHPGLDQFHATLLEPSGSETNVATLDATGALEPGGSAVVLTTRKLDSAGHFVSDAPVQRGTYRFTVSAMTASGEPLGATLDIPVR